MEGRRGDTVVEDSPSLPDGVSGDEPHSPTSHRHVDRTVPIEGARPFDSTTRNS